MYVAQQRPWRPGRRAVSLASSQQPLYFFLIKQPAPYCSRETDAAAAVGVGKLVVAALPFELATFERTTHQYFATVLQMKRLEQFAALFKGAPPSTKRKKRPHLLVRESQIPTALFQCEIDSHFVTRTPGHLCVVVSTFVWSSL